MIVVNLLGNIVLIELLPICGELIWIDLFSYLNTAFCCLSLFQSAFNIMLENFDGDHLFPTPIVVAVQYIKMKLGGHSASPTPSSLVASMSSIRESVAGVLYRADENRIALARHQPSSSHSSSQEARGAKSMEDDLTTSRAEKARKLIYCVVLRDWR